MKKYLEATTAQFHLRSNLDWMTIKVHTIQIKKLNVKLGVKRGTRQDVKLGTRLDVKRGTRLDVRLDAKQLKKKT